VPKSLEIDQDNLRMKFLALNVNFNSVSFNPLAYVQGILCTKASNLGTPRFLLLLTSL